MEQKLHNLLLGSNKEQSDESQQEKIEGVQSEGRWEDHEHFNFLKGLFKFGKNWKEIEVLVPTRTCSQVRSHAQKYFIKLQKIVKNRKKQKIKLPLELTCIESEIVKNFSTNDVTTKTPDILVSLISSASLSQSPNSSAFSFTNAIEPKSALPFEISKESKVNLFEFYEDQEDKSFFCYVMDCIQQYFEQGKIFTDLIDFKNTNKDVKIEHYDFEEAETTGHRKSSFTLFEDEQNNQKLKEAIEKIKGVSPNSE